MTHFVLFAQNNEKEKLAAQYFAEKQYDKAADIYENLLQNKPESVYYYDNLLQCYIFLKDFKSAEKLVEKRKKRFSNDAIYGIDLAYLQGIQNNIAKRDALLNDILNTKINSIEMAENIANGYLKRGFTDYAIQEYINARKQLNQGALFVFELSQLYFSQNKRKEAILELVSIVNENEFILQEVKNKFSSALKTKEDFSLLTSSTLNQLQKSPQSLPLNDLLIWSLVQQKDWELAIIQSKAIDKRFKEDGLWLINLAHVLITNQEYTHAITCYQTIKEFGSEKRYYYQAQQGILHCGMLQIKSGKFSSIIQLRSLESEYINFINMNGINWHTATQIKELAEIYIYHLHEEKKGITWLETAINTQGVNHRLIAECKLDLGDAYLIGGDSWEADLLYKQVEKDFNNDALGQEAKFRYSRLCYFRGEFEWAQTQLDVLKEATTQLISNNAMRLWLLIQDNIGMDTTYEALAVYAQADLLIFQNKLDRALEVLENLSIAFPANSLEDDIYFSKAVILESKGQFKDAEIFYSKVIKDFSFDILADNALINLAKMYEFKMNDTAKAKQMYEFLILNYTGSLFINEARQRYRFLRGDLKNNTIENYWD
ncbi:MAG: tetratricopeptide repeat protein [Bacteroidota bacterium]|nr:tetratricopeptide repeat protein [Bacteroidota bacterium]